MIIFLYGPDAYRRQQKQRELVRAYQEKHSFLTVEKFDMAEDGSIERVREFVKNTSLFGAVQCAVVRSIDTAEDLNFIRWINGFKDARDVIFILVSEKESVPAFLRVLAEKPAFVQEFKNIIGLALREFIYNEAEKRGVRLNETQCVQLAAAYGDTTWALVTELDMMALIDTVELRMPNSTYTGDFFSAIRAIAYGDARRSVPTLEILLDADDSAKVFNILAATVSGKDKIQCADYDAAIKIGRLDYEMALLDFAIR